MGNTINPVAFRLGWTRGWIDTYYAKDLYYPQILHKVLRMRYLLNNLLTELFKGSRRTAYIFSHITITKLVKNFNISVFFYDALTQRVWDRFYGRLLKRRNRIHVKALVYFKKQRRKMTRYIAFKDLTVYHKEQWPKRAKRIWIPPLNLRVFFMLIYSYYKFIKNKLEWSISQMKYWYKVLYYSYQKNPKFVKDGFYNYDKNYLYHLFTIHKFFDKSKHGLVWGGLRGFLRAARSIFYNTFTFTWTLSFLTSLKVVLNRLCKNLFKNDYITFNFYKINNDNTNAMFIANYLAKKFLQGYRKIWYIINPIRRELSWRINIRFKDFIWEEKNKKSLKNKRNLVQNLRKNTLKILANYNNLYSLQLFLNKTLITFDILIISYKCFRDKKLRYLIKKHFFIKALVFLVFRMPLNSFVVFINNYMRKKNGLLYKDNYFWINNVFDDINNNYALISNIQYSLISPLYSSYNLIDIIKLSITAYMKYLNIQYTKYLIKWDYNFYNINKLSLRNKPIKSYFKRLLGYKIQLKGRFTRKQIAAKYVFKEGIIKANSISNDLDYGFATIPLINSAIGIKVWLNWNKPIKPQSVKVL